MNYTTYRRTGFVKWPIIPYFLLSIILLIPVSIGYVYLQDWESHFIMHILTGVFYLVVVAGFSAGILKASYNRSVIVAIIVALLISCVAIGTVYVWRFFLFSRVEGVTISISTITAAFQQLSMPIDHSSLVSESIMAIEAIGLVVMTMFLSFIDLLTNPGCATCNRQLTFRKFSMPAPSLEVMKKQVETMTIGEIIETNKTLSELDNRLDITLFYCPVCTGSYYMSLKHFDTKALNAVDSYTALLKRVAISKEQAEKIRNTNETPSIL